MNTQPPPRLTLFTNPEVTRFISQRELARVFTWLAKSLAGIDLPFKRNDLTCDQWSRALADFLKHEDSLPRDFIQALGEIEALADPDRGPDFSNDRLYDPNFPIPSRLKCAMSHWRATPRPSQRGAGVSPASPAGLRPSQRGAGVSPASPDGVSPAPSAHSLTDSLTPSLPPASPVPSAKSAVNSSPDDDIRAKSFALPSLEPWPQPITDAPALFDQVAERFPYYLVLPAGAADACALWVAHTYVFKAFRLTPRLNFVSPHRGCGKTTALDVLSTLAQRPFRAENMRAAVLFRIVDENDVTLILDEVDMWLPSADELLGLLNAGHKRGARALRYEGGGVRAFNAFAPAALAGLGGLPPTLNHRAIVIPLPEALPGQLVARFDEAHTELEHELARKLARWAQDNFASLAKTDPPMPKTAFNRLADNWRALFALAQVVGGHWPQRAADAFSALTPKRPVETDPAILLLADIRRVFEAQQTDKLGSAHLVRLLNEARSAPGATPIGETKPLTEVRLARLLAQFNIRPETIRLGASRAKGYKREDFAPAFARYLP